MKDIVVPPVAESVSTGVIARWNKAEGEFANVDDVLFEFETDKVTIEVRAEVAGVVARHLVPAGQTVQVGQVVGQLDETARPAAAGEPAAQKARAAGMPVPAAAPVAVAPPPARQETTAPPRPEPRPEPRPAAEVKATPLARKMAEEHQIDLARVVGTGPAGRIREQDVLAYMQQSQAPANGAAQPAAPPPSAPARGVRVERMSQLRQRVAQRLVDAQHTAAMLTTFNECDMSAIFDLRARHKEDFEKKHGVGLGFMGFFVKAATAALLNAPKVNAYIVTDPAGHPAIEFHDYCDIAVAVSTPKGLVVPVLRNTERKSLADIEREIRDLAARARDGKLTLDELQGGTFTISNGGVFGSLMGTPILNPPQTAILGMHVIKNRPVEDPRNPGQIVLRPMMYLALTYDHRMLDGADAVQFLVAIKRAIEDPARLLLDL